MMAQFVLTVPVGKAQAALELIINTLCSERGVARRVAT
jgi:hypothetical protein